MFSPFFLSLYPFLSLPLCPCPELPAFFINAESPLSYQVLLCLSPFRNCIIHVMQKKREFKKFHQEITKNTKGINGKKSMFFGIASTLQLMSLKNLELCGSALNSVACPNTPITKFSIAGKLPAFAAYSAFGFIYIKNIKFAISNKTANVSLKTIIIL